MVKNEMVRWHHLLNGHEFEQTPGDSVDERRLVNSSLWSLKESDTTEGLNNNNSNNSKSMFG